jgi:hypothetical protein
MIRSFQVLFFGLTIFLRTEGYNNPSLGEDVGTNSILSTFMQRLDDLEAQIDSLKKRTTKFNNTCLGKVPATEFKSYLSTVGIFAQVNTAHCHFHQTPVYLTSLGGFNSIWYISGATAIYNATRNTFRVYLSTGDKITASEELLAYAIKLQWTLNWVGFE